MASFHGVYSRDRMTWQTKAQHDTTTHHPDDFGNRDHDGLLGLRLRTQNTGT
jgi:hypothetical protein